MTEEKIIELFNRRDEQAIRECISQFDRYLRKVASAILADPADIEEAVSDTWLAAWDTIPPQRPKYLKLYLARIVRNRAVGIWRKNNAYSRGGGEPMLALEELGQIVGSDSVEETLDMKALSSEISAFLKNQGKLPRMVFVRRYFYVQSIADIAASLGLKESNVRMILSRTRNKLKKYLLQEGYML